MSLTENSNKFVLLRVQQNSKFDIWPLNHMGCFIDIVQNPIYECNDIIILTYTPILQRVEFFK